MISVIVPVYNVEKYLDRCINSIISQTFADLEILLINDGSTDSSGVICEKWKQLDKRIKVVNQKNGGLSNARNKGLELYKGEYVCFVDSDDYLEKDMLENLVYAIKRSHADIAVCNFVYEYENIDKNMPKQYLVDNQIEKELLMTGRNFMLLSAKENNSFGVVVWNKLYKRRVFNNVRFPEGKLHEDEFIFHEIMYYCRSVVCIPQIGYHYFQRKGSITAQGNHILYTMEAFLKRCQFLLNNNDEILTVENEKHLVMPLKNLYKIRKESEILKMKKQYMKIIWKMYQKKWISTWTFVKRTIRCII